MKAHHPHLRIGDLVLHNPNNHLDGRYSTVGVVVDRWITDVTGETIPRGWRIFHVTPVKVSPRYPVYAREIRELIAR